MKQQYGAGRGPIIEIALIEDWRARARTLVDALELYKGRYQMDVPKDLRDQVCALAHEAVRLIAQVLRREQGDRCYDAVVLRRNYYHYGRQGIWTGSDDEGLYVSYDSRLTGAVAEVIWDPDDWDDWSPSFGVKRDMVTFYGAPSIIHELARGTVLEDMADRPLSNTEWCDTRRLRWDNGFRMDGGEREDSYPGHPGHEDEEFDELNPECNGWAWEDEQERAHQEWLENLEMLQYEPEERVRNDIYRD